MMFRRKTLATWTVLSFLCSSLLTSTTLSRLQGSNVPSFFDTSNSILDIPELSASSKLILILTYSNFVVTLCLWIAPYIFPNDFPLWPRDLSRYSSRSFRLPETFLIYGYCLERDARFIVITWVIIYLFVSLMLFRLRDIQDSLFSQILRPQNGMQIQNEAVDTVKTQGDKVNSSVMKSMYIIGFLGTLCLGYGIYYSSMDVSLVLLPAIIRSFLEGYHTIKRSHILLKSFKMFHVNYKNARELTRLDFAVATLHTILQVSHFFHFLWRRSFVFSVSDIPLILVSQRYILVMSERRNRLRWFNVVDREFERIFRSAPESQLLVQGSDPLSTGNDFVPETVSSSSTIEHTNGGASYKTCVICLEPLTSGKILPQCGHVLHKVCLRRYLFSDNNSCPICRKPFNNGEGDADTLRDNRLPFGMPDTHGGHSYVHLYQAIKVLVRDMPYLRMRRNNNTTQMHGLGGMFGNVDRDIFQDELNLFNRARMRSPGDGDIPDTNVHTRGMVLQGETVTPNNPASDSTLEMLYEMFPALDRNALKHHFLVTSRGNIDQTIDAAISGSIPVASAAGNSGEQTETEDSKAGEEAKVPPFVCPMETHRLYPLILKYVISDEESQPGTKPPVEDKFAYTKWRQRNMIEENRRHYLERLMHELLQESIGKREDYIAEYGEDALKSQEQNSASCSSTSSPEVPEHKEREDQAKPSGEKSRGTNTAKVPSVPVAEGPVSASAVSVSTPFPQPTRSSVSPTARAVDTDSMSTTSSMFSESAHVPVSPINRTATTEPLEAARQKRLLAALRRVNDSS